MVMCDGITNSIPGKRATRDEFMASIKIVADHPLLQTVIDSFGSYLMVLNSQRQIVATNRWLLNKLGCESPEKSIGLRPGEALGCVNVADTPCGCGTGKSCTVCGAVLAIVACQQTGKQYRGECTISTARDGKEEELEFEIVATPLPINGEELTVVSLREIKNRKNKERLERIFFHDLMNTISGIYGWSKALMDSSEPGDREIPKRIFELTKKLKMEIEYHSFLFKAEKGDLSIRIENVGVTESLSEIETFFHKHPAAESKNLEIAGKDIVIKTDRSILDRILINMIINAFEATPPGGKIRLWWNVNNESITFSVWSAAIIPTDTALRIFQRSFSTKAEQGRGLGTFSMKLLGEKYLGGKVSFDSRENEGTVFSLTLPVHGPENKPTESRG